MNKQFAKDILTFLQEKESSIFSNNEYKYYTHNEFDSNCTLFEELSNCSKNKT